MSAKVAIYANSKRKEDAMKRRCGLLKYCKWAEHWTTHTSWGPPADMEDFKWFIRSVKRRKGPVDLIFWSTQDLPDGIAPEKLKSYAKGGNVHFVKEKLVF